MSIRRWTIILGVAGFALVNSARGTDRFVSLSGGHTPPFTDWSTAATNIQAAIDAASAGDQIWVSNGVYSIGGTLATQAITTNRITVNKALAIRSLNGPEVTIIEGEKTPITTNGPTSVRCVWLGDGATLSGFTLRNGSTTQSDAYGGGAYCKSAAAILTNCIISANAARLNGGGVFQGTLQSCAIVSNTATTGGGAYNAWLTGCDVEGNRASAGGGVYCPLSGVSIVGSVVANNYASNMGGGAYQGTCSNCIIQNNAASPTTGDGGGAYGAILQSSIVRSNTALQGGGAYNCTMVGSAVSGNTAINQGGGSYGSKLQNCTVIGNRATTGGGALGGAAVNSILYYNLASRDANYSSTGLTNCCTEPLSSANLRNSISAEPELLSDGIHLRQGSPCIGAGTSAGLSGADIDGQPWNNPPSIGCDESNPNLVLVSQPKIVPGLAPGLGLMVFEVAGEPPYCWWIKDGAAVENTPHYASAHSNVLAISHFDVGDAGAYQVIASNSFGMVTSAVSIITVACVDAAGANPSPPYTNWASAATTIQDAVDVGGSGAVILVTNGVYQTGGGVVPGDGTTNRVVLDHPVTVLSLNGPDQTVIEGAWDENSTTGPNSIRCVWIGDGAVVGGVTLRNGSAALDGGGAWSAGTGFRASLVNCVVTNCAAGRNGGGMFQGRLFHSVLAGNTAIGGGGVASGFAENSTLTANSASSGAAASQSDLSGCELTLNTSSQSIVAGGQLFSCMVATNSGLGMRSGVAFNCRFVGNTGGGASSGFVQGSLFRGNSAWGTASCTNLNCTFVQNSIETSGGYSTNCLFFQNGSSGFTPGSWVNCLLQPTELPQGPESPNPWWLTPNLLSDGLHVAANSPAIGRGTSTGIGGLDIDGEPWANPPSIGCDEWNPRLRIVSPPRVVPGSVPGEARLFLEIAGQAPFCWWTKDGAALEDNGHFVGAHSNAVSVLNFDVPDTGTYQVVASNSFGMVTSAVVTVSVACVDQASASPAAPYATWGSAARSIQDAMDNTTNAMVLLVTNGIYSSGIRASPGDSAPTRLVVDRAVTVLSVRGSGQTVIEGAWDPTTTNGPASVRCVWLAEGAMLGGFTLRNGSTTLDGGGAWTGGAGLQDSLVNCVVTNCSAAGNGGGAFQGRLRDCTLLGNKATAGGGAASAILEHCLVQGNSAGNGGGVSQGTIRRSRIFGNRAGQQGGGVAGPAAIEGCVVAMNQAGFGAGINNAKVFQSTVVSNVSTLSPVAGVDFSTVWNSIVYFNVVPGDTQGTSPFANLGGSGNYYKVCYTPYRGLIDGITNNPQLLDLEHCATTSPCRGAGLSLGSAGFDDIDGDAWAAPPSIGCDETVDSGLAGPLSIQLLSWPEIAAGGVMPITALISGRASRLEWDFGDGAVVSDAGFVTAHTWTSAGNYTLHATAFNLDYPTGVVTTASVHVLPVVSPSLDGLTLSNGVFSLQFFGQPGLTYQLQSATNLTAPVDWQPQQTFYSTGGVSTAIAPNVGDPGRFYRLQVE